MDLVEARSAALVLAAHNLALLFKSFVPGAEWQWLQTSLCEMHSRLDSLRGAVELAEAQSQYQGQHLHQNGDLINEEVSPAPGSGPGPSSSSAASPIGFRALNGPATLPSSSAGSDFASSSESSSLKQQQPHSSHQQPSEVVC